MIASAQLIFDSQTIIALPQLLDLLRGHLREGDFEDGTLTESSLTSMTLENGNFLLTLSMRLSGEECIVTLALSTGMDAPMARLAQLTYALVDAAKPQAVIWSDTGLRIPARAFLDGLARSFAPKPAADVHVMPRRVGTPSVHTARPAPYLTRKTDTRYDAHVAAHEAHLRDSLRRDATMAEIAALRAPTERLSNVAAGARAAMRSAELRAASLLTTLSALMLAYSGGSTV